MKHEIKGSSELRRYIRCAGCALELAPVFAEYEDPEARKQAISITEDSGGT